MLYITANGNLGKDPVIKTVGDTKVAEFSIAARTGRDETTWVDCAVWGRRAETIERFIHKGDKITVIGQGKLETFNKRDGSEGKALRLRVNDFTLPPKKEEVPF